MNHYSVLSKKVTGYINVIRAITDQEERQLLSL